MITQTPASAAARARTMTMPSMGDAYFKAGQIVAACPLTRAATTTCAAPKLRSRNTSIAPAPTPRPCRHSPITAPSRASSGVLLPRRPLRSAGQLLRGPSSLSSSAQATRLGPRTLLYRLHRRPVAPTPSAAASTTQAATTAGASTSATRRRCKRLRAVVCTQDREQVLASRVAFARACFCDALPGI